MLLPMLMTFALPLQIKMTQLNRLKLSSFVDRNGLKLSTEKCGIVIAGRDGMDPPPSVAGLPVEESVKCLGVWWCSNSTSKKSVEECL